LSSYADETRRVGRNVTVMAAGQLITWTMTLLWTFVVPRSLGPAGLGTIMAAWSITGIFGVVLGLGTRNYLVRESVVEPEAASGLVGNALVLRVLLSPVIIGAAFAYGQIVGWNHDAKTVLYLAAAATIFVQIAEPLQAAFQSLEEMQYLAYSDIISKSGQGLVGIVVVLLGAGTIGVTACWAIMTGLVVLLDLYWLHGRLRIDPRTNLRRMVTMAKASLPYWAFGLFFMVYLWIDFVMLSLLTSNKVVGWYAVPTRLFQTLMFLPVVIATAWLPRFVRAFEESPEQLGREARPPLELVVLLSLPIASLTILAAHPLIDLLYGSDYARSGSVMVGLGLCIPAMYLNIMLAQVLIAMNRQMVWTWVMAGTVVINPLFNLALIPFTQHHYGNGAIGASISLLLTELVCIGAGYVLIGRLVFNWDSARRTVLGLCIAGAMWGVGYWIDSMGPALPGLVAAGLTFVLLAWLLGLFSPEELALMRTGLDKVRNKVPGLKRNVAEAALEAPPTS
jgi:O-antigen/teichoic acid export membrane protein